jgi:hypothetical protein
MRKLICITVLMAAFASSALAKTHQIPRQAPVASIVVPDEWKVIETATGLEVSIGEDEAYLVVEATKATSMARQLNESALGFLQRAGVTIDPATKKERRTKFNGLDFLGLSWSGKDKNGDVVVHLAFLAVSAKGGLLFTYLATPDADKKYDPATTQLVKSVKKLGK